MAGKGKLSRCEGGGVTAKHEGQAKACLACLVQLSLSPYEIQLIDNKRHQINFWRM